MEFQWGMKKCAEIDQLLKCWSPFQNVKYWSEEMVMGLQLKLVIFKRLNAHIYDIIAIFCHLSILAFKIKKNIYEKKRNSFWLHVFDSPH